MFVGIRSISTILCWVLSAVLLSSCIVPPNVQRASVVPERDLELVSMVRRGKDFSRSGRMDLAEREFRRAIQMRPGLDNLYNDLGYALHAQTRYEEAEEYYRLALEVEPNNAIARSNLARLLYQDGRYRAALKQYLQLIDITLASSSMKMNQTIGEPFDERELVEIYRNLAHLYYTVGVLDDAVCYSWLAYILGANMYQAGQHARLLLSIDRNDTALQILREVFVNNQGVVPAKVLLDYGIALYLTGNTTLAKTAASRVLTQKDAERIDRRTARLLGLLVAPEDDRDLLSETLLEEDPELCDYEELDTDKYWPIDFEESVEQLMTALCNESGESFNSTQS